MFKKLSKKKGFTLMEMMIVVAIIAVLMAVIIPTFTNAMNKAKAATDEANLRAYYAEVMAESVLDGKAPNVTKGDLNSFSVSGVTYTLKGGKATVDTNSNNQVIITYTPDNDKSNPVQIPGTK